VELVEDFLPGFHKCANTMCSFLSHSNPDDERCRGFCCIRCHARFDDFPTKRTLHGTKCEKLEASEDAPVGVMDMD
jgi:hypothetical protein